MMWRDSSGSSGAVWRGRGCPDESASLPFPAKSLVPPSPGSHCRCPITQSCPTLQPHGLQHTRLSCPSLSPRACSNSCPLSRRCHPTISSTVTPFSFCPQSFPAPGSFPMSQLFPSGGQSTGASASASVLPVNSGLISLGWTGWISLLSKGLSRAFSSTTVREHQHFSTQPSLRSNGQRHLSHLLNLSHQVPHSLSAQSNASSAREVGNARTSATTLCLALSVWHCQTSCLARRH